MPDLDNLADDVFDLFANRDASNAEGIAVLISMLITMCRVTGHDKARFMESISTVWDMVQEEEIEEPTVN